MNEKETKTITETGAVIMKAKKGNECKWHECSRRLTKQEAERESWVGVCNWCVKKHLCNCPDEFHDMFEECRGY